VPSFQAEADEAAAASESGRTAPCPSEALSESLPSSLQGMSGAQSAEAAARGDAEKTRKASEASLEPVLESKGFQNGLGEGLTEDAKGGRHCEIAGGSELVRARPNEQRAGASTVDTEAAETNRESQSEPISAVEAELNVSGPAGALGGSTTRGPSNGAEGEALAGQEEYGRLHSSAI
jgi:hypothetical protein